MEVYCIHSLIIVRKNRTCFREDFFVKMASIRNEIREAVREEVTRLLSGTSPSTSSSEESRHQHDSESRSSSSNTPSCSQSGSNPNGTLSFENISILSNIGITDGMIHVYVQQSPNKCTTLISNSCTPGTGY